MSALRNIARFTSWTGLTAVGALHLIWASGSPWPERNRKRLSEAVVGNSRAFPDAAGTAVVGAGAIAAGALAGGALGEGRAATGARRVIGIALLARAALGGGPALAAMGLPPAGRRFRELDGTFYRPLCAVLGVATLIGARGGARRRERGARQVCRSAS